MKPNLPRITLIFRDYTKNEIISIIDILKDSKYKYALEITLNTKNALNIIEDIVELYGHQFLIGAGSVFNLKDTIDAVNHGARFILSPVTLDKESVEYCNQNNIICITGAYTPSEVYEMYNYGADFIKLFPINSLGFDFVNSISAPLPKIKYMAVGGVNKNNIENYLNNGIEYVGIGSGIFKRDDIKNNNINNIKKSLLEFESKLERM